MADLYGGASIIGEVNGARGRGTLALILPPAPGGISCRFLTAGHAVGPNGSKLYDAAENPIGTVQVNLACWYPSGAPQMYYDIAWGVFDPGIPYNLHPMMVAWPGQDGMVVRRLAPLKPNPRHRFQLEFCGAVSGYRQVNVSSLAKPYSWMWDDVEYQWESMMEIQIPRGSSNLVHGDSGAPLFFGDELVGVYSGSFRTEEQINGFLFTHIGPFAAPYL